jgi:hypothetical protein
MAGFVYLIRNGDLHKIGRTDNLGRRMKQLQPDEILQVLETDRSRDLEHELHEQFKAKRLPQTEYFRLTPQDVATVRVSLSGGSTVAVTDAARRRVDESERKWNEEQAKKKPLPPVDQGETDRRYREYLARIRGTQT